ncbi:MAG: hypothetical protein L3J24_00140 [Xanthomonadales bacterium]|nr:hypothetical protein [Xanthomonadales bacterium]
MTKTLILAILLILASNLVWAHDPIFGMGPHVLFKQGIEASIEIDSNKSAEKQEFIHALQLTYGITGNWSAGIEIPYAFKQRYGANSQGFANLNIFTKYRFWRKDSLGLQESAAVILQVKTDSGSITDTPALGTDTTDGIVGLAYGYEGRTWYRWASLRYRYNGTTNAGLQRGNKVLLDLVAGVRTNLTSYTEADTVWLLELNGEFSDTTNLNGFDIANTGGRQWFLSPGIFWTKRNFAIKAGLQIPITASLNGNQNQDDYRAKLVFEWHP